MADRALYTQVDTRAFMHPDWFDAGPDGFFAFAAAEGLLRENPNSGYLPPNLARPEVLAPRVCSMGLTAERVATALHVLSEVGLIDLDEDGGIYFPKWEERGHKERPAKSDAERKREQRKRERAASHESVTGRHVTPRDNSVTCHESVTQESRDVTNARARASGSPSGSSGTPTEETPPPTHPSSEHWSDAYPSADQDGRKDGPGSVSDPGPTRSTAGLGLDVVAAACRADEHPPDRSGVPRRRGAESVRRAVG